MTTIQWRRDTAAAWTAANTVLAEGEAGFETDTGKVKVGNGTTSWTGLPYMLAQWSTITGKPAVIAAGATKAEARSAIDAEDTNNRGQANGYASLDGGGKVPVAQLPNSIMSYQGLWNASTNTPTLADGTGDPGDVYRVSVGGSRNLGSGSITFDVGDYVIYSPASSAWEKADTTDAVSSVNGYTGNITLAKSDVGLGNVDNTSDATKNSATATLTNKTISGASNTLTNIGNTSLTNSAITIAGTSTSLGGSITQDTITGLSSTGLVKRTGANTLAVATSGTDYAPATSGSAVLKGNGAGGFSSAVSSTDYAPATSGSSVLKGNGSGGFSSAVAGTDIVVPGGALGTPSSGTLTNCTGLTVSGISATGTANSTTYLRGDGSWQTVSGGISTGKAIAMAMVFG